MLRLKKFIKRLLLLVMLAGLGACAYYVNLAYREVQGIAEARAPQTPTRIYASPTVLRPGQSLGGLELIERLRRLGYREVGRIEHVGEFRRAGAKLEIYLRPFVGLDGPREARFIAIRLTGDRIVALHDLKRRHALDSVVLEPELLSSVYGTNPEEYIHIGLAQCPPELIMAVIAVEDKRFYKHHGIDLLGVMRAAGVNLRAGEVREGASTLTQQLIKNRFLTSERTFKRKFKEGLMAVLLEVIYPKDKILEFYLNEVYLGQSGPAGIYGFGQAARYYFDKEPWRLNLSETALLAGLIRAPNIYSPHRHPERALKRRNTVLALMFKQGLIDQTRYSQALNTPLKLAPPRNSARLAPYFVDFVLENLASRYTLERLGQGGYSIFTTLDPAVQLKAERRLARQLASLNQPGLDGALVVLDATGGEVRAMVGGRDYPRSQFNRAVKLRRNIGSLVKPVVYYEALLKSWRLSDKIVDEPITLPAEGGSWTPRNYDGAAHGEVMLIEALANSYNLATVRLGHSVGAPAVRARIRALAPEAVIYGGPAMLLGAVASSPYEMAGFYQPFATGGIKTRPTWLKAIVASDGNVVERPVRPQSRRVLDAGRVYLVNLALKRAVTSGTAAAAPAYGLPAGACGKTGTTDEYRDSWFVGYTARNVCCVWLGHDDYRPSGLSGAKGAMPVAAGLLGDLGPARDLPVPSTIVWRDIDPHDGKLARDFNRDKLSMPFVRGTEPQDYSSGQVFRFIKGFFWRKH